MDRTRPPPLFTREVSPTPTATPASSSASISIPNSTPLRRSSASVPSLPEAATGSTTTVCIAKAKTAASLGSSTTPYQTSPILILLGPHAPRTASAAPTPSASSKPPSTNVAAFGYRRLAHGQNHHPPRLKFSPIRRPAVPPPDLRLLTRRPPKHREAPNCISRRRGRHPNPRRAS